MDNATWNLVFAWKDQSCTKSIEHTSRFWAKQVISVLSFAQSPVHLVTDYLGLYSGGLGNFVAREHWPKAPPRCARTLASHAVHHLITVDLGALNRRSIIVVLGVTRIALSLCACLINVVDGRGKAQRDATRSFLRHTINICPSHLTTINIFFLNRRDKPIASMKKKKGNLSDCHQRPASQRNTKSQTSQLKIIATHAEASVKKSLTPGHRG